MSLVDIKIGEKVLVKSVQSLDQLLKRRLAALVFSEGSETSYEAESDVQRSLYIGVSWTVN